jgi:hypothetical protein
VAFPGNSQCLVAQLVQRVLAHGALKRAADRDLCTMLSFAVPFCGMGEQNIADFLATCRTTHPATFTFGAKRPTKSMKTVKMLTVLPSIVCARCAANEPAHAAHTNTVRACARARAQGTERSCKNPSVTPRALSQLNVGVVVGLAIASLIFCAIFIGICILMASIICRRRQRTGDVRYRSFDSGPTGSRAREGTFNTARRFVPPVLADCSLQAAYQAPNPEHCAPCTPGRIASS